MEHRPAHWVLLLLAWLAAPAAGAASDWPQWHGPQRDRHLPPAALLPAELPKEPKAIWSLDIGGGHSSPVVADGRLVYLDEDGTNEVAHCLEAASGKELWRQAYAERQADEWGPGPRSTPAVAGEQVYAQSCKGEFRCLSLRDGQLLWGFSFARDYGVQFLGPHPREGGAKRRGHNGSPLVDGEEVIVPVGSTNGASVVCVNRLTGRLKWKAGSDEAAYSSPLVATLAGVRQVVYLSADALMGLERETGRVLWRVPLVTFAQRHAATPVLCGDTVIVNSHTFGLACFRIERRGEGLVATEQWRNPDLKINLATPTLVDGYLYSQGANRDYICVKAATGALQWAQDGFGGGGRDYAATLAAGGRLLVLAGDGALLLLAADPAKYAELGRLQPCGVTWSFPAYCAGRLYVRDARQLRCYQLAER